MFTAVMMLIGIVMGAVVGVFATCIYLGGAYR